MFQGKAGKSGVKYELGQFNPQQELSYQEQYFGYEDVIPVNPNWPKPKTSKEGLPRPTSEAPKTSETPKTPKTRFEFVCKAFSISYTRA